MKVEFYGKPHVFGTDPAKFLIAEAMRLGCTVHIYDGTMAPDADLVISLGGDGTFLRAVTAMGQRQIPIAGVNFGRLGFLTTAKVDVNGDNGWFANLLHGGFSTEPRSRLEVSSQILPDVESPYCLNEFSVQRIAPSMLQIEVEIDGWKLPCYNADGVLVSTPTGSTAYSLSVGGPVVTPTSEVFIITPIAPHNLNVRPIVVPDTSTVRISYCPDKRNTPAVATMDNRYFPVKEGDTFTITKCEYPVQYVTLRELNFIDALKDKLLWGGDIRNTL